MILSYKQVYESNVTPNIGDIVVCIGNVDELKTHNHIGYLREGGIEFLRRWSDRLHDLQGKLRTNNGWYIGDPSWTKPFDNNRRGNNYHLIFSPKFREIISYSLNYLQEYENMYYCDVSYIDITSRNDTVSCLSASNIRRLEQNEDPWKSTMRQNVRIGRFLKKITNDTDSIIEDYVNEYKFSYNLGKSEGGRFRVSKGIDMAKWYLEMLYAPGGGTLNASCMRHVRSQKRLPIYTNNPERVKMLYLLNPEDKLLGRALIWRLSEPKDVFYMDRIYYTEDYIEKLFLDYARKKKLLTRDTVEKNKMTLKVKLNMDYGPPNKNPFMDTFKYFDRNKLILTNRFDNFNMGEYWEYVDHD